MKRTRTKPKGKIDAQEISAIIGAVGKLLGAIVRLIAPPVTPEEILAVVACAQALVVQVEDALLD